MSTIPKPDIDSMVETEAMALWRALKPVTLCVGAQPGPNSGIYLSRYPRNSTPGHRAGQVLPTGKSRFPCLRHSSQTTASRSSQFRVSVLIPRQWNKQNLSPSRAITALSPSLTSLSLLGCFKTVDTMVATEPLKSCKTSDHILHGIIPKYLRFACLRFNLGTYPGPP